MSEQSRLDYILADRRKKLAELEAQGINPFPSHVERTYTAAQARVADGKRVSIAGRITAIREHGKMVFADVRDSSGDVQVNWRHDELAPERFRAVKLLDPGDFIAVTGTVFRTKTDEPTVLIASYAVLAKALRPVPSDRQEIENVDERFRKRYLDLLINSGVRERFHQRSAIIQAIRRYYEANGFTEVETPILQLIPGGAMAQPFQTHYNAYDADVYLRIAPELYLKRLLIGGYERVFEFARCFRNEQADATHNPEFTQVESYVAYWDYEDLMGFVEQMVSTVVKEVFGTQKLKIGGQEISFAAPFARTTFLEVSGGHREDAKFKEGTQGIIQPTFVTNHPKELVPLAKRDPSNPGLVQSFQLVIAGVEVAKAYSELNDPVEQQRRFEEQEQARSGGDEEAQRNDPDFIEALEYGMPPAAGLGVGIDRLVSLLTDAGSLREVMLFPFMKPRPDSRQDG